MDWLCFRLSVFHWKNTLFAGCTTVIGYKSTLLKLQISEIIRIGSSFHGSYILALEWFRLWAKQLSIWQSSRKVEKKIYFHEVLAKIRTHYPFQKNKRCLKWIYYGLMNAVKFISWWIAVNRTGSTKYLMLVCVTFNIWNTSGWLVGLVFVKWRRSLKLPDRAEKPLFPY